MPRERVAMRKIREILRLVWGCNQSRRDTAKACSVGKSTLNDTIYRATAFIPEAAPTRLAGSA